MQGWTVDHDYVKTLGMKILKGRDFSIDHPTDSAAAIINRSAEQQLGWIDPLGKSIGLPVSVIKEKMKLYNIIGVVEDFHFESLRDSVGPLVMVLGRNRTRMSIRIGTQNIQKTLGFIRDKWNQHAPGQPFEYSFLDRRFEAMYRSESRTGEIIGFFSGLSILICGLGLFGLAAYLTEKRIKEIGIRKVMGASVREIVFIVCKDFIKPVIIANLFAWPLAYYVMSLWLQRFAYRIQIGIDVFILAAGLTFIIALTTVSMQAVKAAITDPVRTLRYE
jgi:putative ABC transport system permease protein